MVIQAGAAARSCSSSRRMPSSSGTSGASRARGSARSRCASSRVRAAARPPRSAPAARRSDRRRRRATSASATASPSQPMLNVAVLAGLEHEPDRARRCRRSSRTSGPRRETGIGSPASAWRSIVGTAPFAWPVSTPGPYGFARRRIVRPSGAVERRGLLAPELGQRVEALRRGRRLLVGDDGGAVDVGGGEVGEARPVRGRRPGDRSVVASTFERRRARARSSQRTTPMRAAACTTTSGRAPRRPRPRRPRPRGRRRPRRAGGPRRLRRRDEAPRSARPTKPEAPVTSTFMAAESTGGPALSSRRRARRLRPREQARRAAAAAQLRSSRSSRSTASSSARTRLRAGQRGADARTSSPSATGGSAGSRGPTCWPRQGLSGRRRHARARVRDDRATGETRRAKRLLLAALGARAGALTALPGLGATARSGTGRSSTRAAR